MFRAKKFSWDGEEVKVTYAIEREGGDCDCQDDGLFGREEREEVA